MKQAVMTKPGVIEYRDIETPHIESGQIKIKMKRIGVCGSDIHVNHGKHPYTGYPVVQGHEVAGVVLEIAPDVTGFKPGDKVTVQPQVVCGECYPCTHGMYNVCEYLKVMGFQTSGMASEYFVTDAVKVLKLPEAMSFDHGAMIEPLAVAVHAVRRFGNIDGKMVLVLGGGPIGNLVAQTCKSQGAKKVLLSEISEYRLAVARTCGIDTVNPSQCEPREKAREFFGSDGADVIFECVGINTTMEQAINIARKGSNIVVVGVFAEPATINMGYVQDRELTLAGTAMYRTEDYMEAIRLVENGSIELEALITDHVPFGEYSRAYKLIDERKDHVMKVIIDMD